MNARETSQAAQTGTRASRGSRTWWLGAFAAVALAAGALRGVGGGAEEARASSAPPPHAANGPTARATAANAPSDQARDPLEARVPFEPGWSLKRSRSPPIVARGSEHAAMLMRRWRAPSGSRHESQGQCRKGPIDADSTQR